MRWLLKNVMNDLMPRTEHFPGAADTDLDAFLKRFMREAPIDMRFGLVMSAAIYMVCPLFTVGLPLPTVLLPGVLRDLHAQRVTKSPIYLFRQLMFLTKMMVGLCWGADADVRARAGLSPLTPDPQTWRSA